ncbi:uncharacterized protein [Linepithema humile]|uniref:uncharacterized protein isoform X1 n=2 Tax=Linepithema humile TaxID=83485 RepID=UPI00351E342C
MCECRQCCHRNATKARETKNVAENTSTNKMAGSTERKVFTRLNIAIDKNRIFTMSDTSDSDDESRPYVIVQFVTRGRKGSIKQLDIVPRNWLDWNAKTKKIKCKFLPPPYTERDSELLHNIVKNLDTAPTSWPEYTVEIKAHGKTYADALLRLQLLNDKEFAFTSNSNEDQNEKSKKVENSIRKKKLLKNEEQINELFNSVTTVEEFLHEDRLPNESFKILKKTGEKSYAEKIGSSKLSNSSKCENLSKRLEKKNKCTDESAICDTLFEDECMSQQTNDKNYTAMKNDSYEESSKDKHDKDEKFYDLDLFSNNLDQQCQEENVLLFENEIPVISTIPNILTNQLNEGSADVIQQLKSAIEINDTMCLFTSVHRCRSNIIEKH